MAPDPDLIPIRTAMPKLGLLPAAVAASHLCVVWDNRDVPTIPSRGPALLILEAGAEKLTLTAHPFDIERGPLTRTGIPGVVPIWQPMRRVDPTRIPPPVRGLLATWRTPPTSDLTTIRESLEWSGYLVSLPAARRNSLRVVNGSSSAVPAWNALRTATRTGELPSAQHAIDVAEHTFDTWSQTGRPLAEIQSILSAALVRRYKHTGVDADRRRALTLAQAAACAESDRPLTTALFALSEALRAEYRATGEIVVLQEAIRAAEQTIHAMDGEDYRSIGLVNLSALLSDLYWATGDPESLDRALELSREAVSVAHADLLLYGTTLVNHANQLRLVAERTGDQTLLEEAITVLRTAVRILPPSHVDASTAAVALADSLRNWHELTGDFGALQASIEAAQRASEVCAPGDPEAGACDTALSLSLWVRYRRGSATEDIDAAVAFARSAVVKTPRKAHQFADVLANLAVVLKARYEACGELTDLGEATSLVRQTLLALPADDPRVGPIHGTLGTLLALRFNAVGDEADLDGAITAARVAVVRSDSNTQTGAISRFNLAMRLVSAGDAEIDEALALLEHSAHTVELAISMRITAAREWGRIAWAANRGDSAATGFGLAVELLPQLVPIALRQSDAEYWLSSMSGLTADAVACTIRSEQPERALELAELGRGVLLAQALDMRTELTRLREHRPALADRFEQLAAGLERDSDDDSAARRHRRRADTILDVIAEIRKTPGFERFLQAPAVTELLAESASGPIVLVNSSEYGCDALIVTVTGVRVCPLPMLRIADIGHRVPKLFAAVHQGGVTSPFRSRRLAAEQDLSEILGWLWWSVAAPVLDCIEPDAGGPIRLRWILTGLLGLFPMHAATDPADTHSSLLDRSVSSYLPTIRALSHARLRPRSDGRPKPLIVSMPATPGASSLEWATHEAAHVATVLPGSVTLQGDAATFDGVVAELQTASWAHFVCHALSESAMPSRSRLLLHDHSSQPLDVRSLNKMRLPAADFAFLSACQTAVPAAELVDETIHIASSFQLAGFRTVIGTLWPIRDEVGAAISEAFYAALCSDPTAHLDLATVLNHAVRRVRDSFLDSPSNWAGHIHVGL
ncbi:CHAT domain-containing protein [Nocardia salmonicida]|uniref:CHAT domain-containing protein n=1 Tax=Nocardia salmonicida TaxID=53431 RepID=UPI0033D389A8